MVVERVLYDTDEAAQALHVSRSTLFVLMREGRLRGVKVGRSRRFLRSEIEEFGERLKAEAAAGDRGAYR